MSLQVCELQWLLLQAASVLCLHHSSIGGVMDITVHVPNNYIATQSSAAQETCEMEQDEEKQTKTELRL